MSQLTPVEALRAATRAHHAALAATTYARALLAGEVALTSRRRRGARPNRLGSLPATPSRPARCSSPVED